MKRDRNREWQLLDHYGALLTEHQRIILEEYCNEDLSMNEIAENYDISKSAVQDLIRRCEKQLNEYEEKLGTIAKERDLTEVIEEMKASDQDLLQKYARKIESILKGE